MAYGDDITEGIPYVLSNPAGAINYSATGVGYDMAIAGLPFFIAASDESPYRRVTAKYRKEQYDQTREAGEQSLTGWWFRSQSTFHLGAGIKYFEPAQDESLRFQFTESKGVDVFTKGQVTLLNSTASFYSGAAPAQLIGVNDGTSDCIIITDGTAIKKITSAAVSSTIAQVGTASTILSVTTDGSNYYFVNGTTIHKGSVGVTPADAILYAAASTTRATIRYVKQRLIAAIGSSIYELDSAKTYSSTINNAAVVAGTVTLTTSAVHGLIVGDTVTVIDLPAPFTAYNVSATVTAVGSTTTFSYVVGSATVTSAATTGKFLKTTLPTALFTHPNSSWVWSSISEGPSAIYISGYDPNGTSSSVFRIQLDVTIPNSLGFPTLETPTVIIDLPEGERINDFDVYLGRYAVLATNKGFRAGISDVNGNIQYGPLLFDQAGCNSIAFRDRFAYLATTIDSEAGLVKVDLSTTVLADSLVFPWAWDLVMSGVTAASNQVAFFGNTDRAAFSSGNVIYAESTTNKVTSGYLQTGFIRYNTLESKLFKLLNPRIDTTNGAISIRSVDYQDNEYILGGFAQGVASSELGVPYPNSAQEYLAFKFTFTRSSTDATKGPLFTGYQLKSLPAVPRQRIIQYPLFCYDHESDNLGVEVGYEGSAYDRLSQLEAVENVGDTIRVEDFRTGESYIGLIEELDFINRTPSDRRFSGYGGMLIATIRLI
jgi:hypothetical protein